MSNDRYEEYNKILQGTKSRRVPNLVSLDPGETMGWAKFHLGDYVKSGQTRIVQDGVILWDNMLELFKDLAPEHIICEDYKIYAHKLQQHSFSPVITLRIIGAIDLWAHVNSVPIDDYQMATTAKIFVTDDKLKRWGFYKEAEKHARDAIRHALYYQIVTCRP